MRIASSLERAPSTVSREIARNGGSGPYRRGVLKKALIEHLRTHRPIRRSRHATAKADTRGEIPDMVSIRERPARSMIVLCQDTGKATC